MARSVRPTVTIAVVALAMAAGLGFVGGYLVRGHPAPVTLHGSESVHAVVVPAVVGFGTEQASAVLGAAKLKVGAMRAVRSKTGVLPDATTTFPPHSGRTRLFVDRNLAPVHR